MTLYIALLRGINVSGHKIIKMENLRATFAALGFKDAITYVQSGNVIFKAPIKSNSDLLSKQIEARILKDFGFDVPVILRTAAELEEIACENPFLKMAAIDHSKLYITFLAEPAPPGAEKTLSPLAAASEQIRIRGREIYLYCPHGYGNTKLSNSNIEKKISLRATTRNCKSVNALLALVKD